MYGGVQFPRVTDRAGRILIVDDDADVLTAARLLLKRHFALVQTDTRPENLPSHLEKGPWDVILLDMNFAIGADSGGEGLKWLASILVRDPAAVVVLMTAYGDEATAVEAIKQGATDFVLKPWQNERLVATITAAARLRDSRTEVVRLRSRQRELQSLSAPTMVGNSPAMERVQDMIARAAPTDANVLVLGENGTGKELVAKAVHEASARRDEAFTTVDLGSVAEGLFESELFGHRKGAFTDAVTDRVGRFQAVSGGTLVLDEIGNLPLHLQGKLLSVLERREVIPVGSNQAVPVDVRLISATNRPLRKMVKEERFREDLLYRINTVEILLPPLRERAEDIPLLLEHFMEIYARKYGVPNRRIAAGAIKSLSAYRWPGNVRELRHAVERALVMSDSPVLKTTDFFFAPEETAPTDDTLLIKSFNLEAVEHEVIKKVLTRHQGQVSAAARELGITRASLYRRMQKYGL